MTICFFCYPSVKCVRPGIIPTILSPLQGYELIYPIKTTFYPASCQHAITLITKLKLSSGKIHQLDLNSSEEVKLPSNDGFTNMETEIK